MFFKMIFAIYFLIINVNNSDSYTTFYLSLLVELCLQVDFSGQNTLEMLFSGFLIYEHVYQLLVHVLINLVYNS
jgi:hypothetical protein